MTRVTGLVSYTASTATSMLKPENKHAQNTSRLDPHKEGSIILWIQKTQKSYVKNFLFPNEEDGDPHKHLMPSNTLTEWPPPSSTCNRRNCISEQLKQPSKHSRWSRLTRLPPVEFEILHLAWYAPTYTQEPKMLNIRGKPNIHKIQTLLFWTNLAAITEECFLWLLLCSLPFIYIE